MVGSEWRGGGADMDCGTRPQQGFSEIVAAIVPSVVDAELSRLELQKHCKGW